MSVDPDEIETVVMSRPTAPNPTPTPLPRGERFAPGALLASRYRIVSKLGKGGMGEVFRADDLILGQQVALKFLPESAKKNVNLLSRFYDEVRIARQISHKNVCRVYDIGEVEGQLYLSMEYIDGEDLGSLLRRIGRLPSDKALEFTRKLCAGVAAAHQQGVLHRDLKPANIMIDGQGELHITDFGLAAVGDHITGAEVRNGTPLYMAPEQLTGREVSVQSDIYALGLVLYEMFTGKQPHQASTVAEMARLRQESSVASLTTLVHDVDPIVEKAILKCLEPDPKMRPTSALALAASLPGADALTAALAAGETPTPEVVAASGSNEALSPRLVLGALATLAISILITCFVSPRFHLVNKLPYEFPPEALTAKARDILRNLGYAERPVDSTSGFYRENELLGYLEKNVKNPDWDKLMSAPPSYGAFYYRQSQAPMAAEGAFPGPLTRTDPPMSQPGMELLDLDLDGRLRQFKAIPPQFEESPQHPPPNWDALFAAAKLDRSAFQPAEPQWAPLVASDARMAWTGVYPGELKIPVRVEAAAQHGRPVYFQLIWPWTKPGRVGAPPPKTTMATVLEYAGGIVVAAILIATLVVARYNWKAGRGDRKGAIRLALWISGLTLASRLLTMNHTLSDAAGAQVQQALARSALAFAIYWLLYLTVEPWVRRIWPQTLVGWSRVLSGKINDPLVGRDVLFGCVLGFLYILFIQLFEFVVVRYMTDTASGDFSFQNLSGFRFAASALASTAADGVTSALLLFLVLFFGKALLRKQWLAGIAFVIMFTLNKVEPGGTGALWFQTAFWVCLWSLIVFTMLRFGFFALTVTMCTINLVQSGFLTTDFTAWYGQSSWFVLAVVAGLAWWGSRLALGGKPLFPTGESS